MCHVRLQVDSHRKESAGSGVFIFISNFMRTKTLWQSRLTSHYHPTPKNYWQNRQRNFLYSWPLSSVHYIMHFSMTQELSLWICNYEVTNLGVVAAFFRWVHKMWKVSVSFVTYVCVHGATRLPLDKFSWNLIFEDFQRSIKKIQVSLKSFKINGYFTWRPGYVHLWYLTDSF